MVIEMLLPFYYHVFKITVYQHGHFAHLARSLRFHCLCLNVFVCRGHRVLEGDCPSASCPSHLIIQG